MQAFSDRVAEFQAGLRAAYHPARESRASGERIASRSVVETRRPAKGLRSNAPRNHTGKGRAFGKAAQAWKVEPRAGRLQATQADTPLVGRRPHDIIQPLPRDQGLGPLGRLG